MPYFKKAPADSPKLLIGDNLSSHVSLQVIQQCQLNNIRFVLLPPNSTNYCQPLDVAYFRPLKMKWKETLFAWKMKNRGCIPKDRFPYLLKKCIQTLDDGGQNLISGFQATGIHPFCPTEVMKRMPDPTSPPDADENSGELWKDSFQAYLNETRKSETIQVKKKKKIDVKAGKSHTGYGTEVTVAQDEDEADENVVDDPEAIDISSEENENGEESDNDTETDNSGSTANMRDENVKENLKVGNYVSVDLTYGMGRNKSGIKTFAAKTININGNNVTLEYLRQSTKASNVYCFPEIDDIGHVKRHQIKAILTPIFERRGRICLPLEK